MRTLATIYTERPAIPSVAPKTYSIPPPEAAAQQRSPWHSPVPYLFGGLAAMLGLIAFALLILACSYWKLSGRSDDNNGENGERDVESGEKESSGDSSKSAKVYEEKILVIMAGDQKPTFLATPVFSKTSCLGNGKETITCKEGKDIENGEKIKESRSDVDDEQMTTTSQDEENRENPGQVALQNR